MEMEVNIGISNRHVHLNKEVYSLLFDDDMKVVKYLNQPNNYVSDKTVTLIAGSYEKENVKVLGPLREYNQVEISHNDAIKFKLNPPVRASGDLEGAEVITLKTPKGSVTLPCCIIAQRHIHMSKNDAIKYNLVDTQKVLLKVGNEKKGTIEAFIKITDEAFLEAHLDTDDANAFLLNNDDKGLMII